MQAGCLHHNSSLGDGSTALEPADSERDLVEVTPEDAMAAELPPVRFCVDITGTEWIPDVLGAPEEYLFLAGPAESALFLTVLPLPETTADAESFRAIVKHCHGEDEAFAFGEQGFLFLNGFDCPALVYSGRQNGTPVVCGAIAIPSPDTAESPGLLILFGDAGAPGSTTLHDLRSAAPFAQLFDSFRWDFNVAEESDGDAADDEYQEFEKDDG